MRRWIAIAVFLGGCDRAEPTTPQTPPTSPVPAVKAPPTPTPAIDAPTALTGCAALNRADCLTSTTCTLHRLASNFYECRTATGPCEIGLAQDDKKSCEARATCRFVPAKCYCTCPSPGVTMAVPDTIPNGYGCGCACGGGPPSMCVERPAKP